MKAQRGSRGVVLSFFKLGASWGWVINATSWPIYSRERLGTHRTGNWMGHGAGLNGCGKKNPNRVSNTIRPAS